MEEGSGNTAPSCSEAIGVNRYTLFYILAYILCFLPIILHNANNGFWRDDCLSYFSKGSAYFSKFVAEGRFVNYLLIDFIRVIPSEVAWLFSFILFSLFFLQIAKKIVDDRLSVLLLTITFMSAPAIYAQLYWPPVSLLPAAVLCVSPLLARRVPYYLSLPVLSIVSFGMVSWIAYFLPLLFLDKQKETDRAALYWSFQLLVVWGLSLCAGYLAANLSVYLETGHGMELMAWRKPNPVETFADLIVNTENAASTACTQFKGFFPLWPFIAACVALTLLYSLIKQTNLDESPRILIGLLFGLAIAVVHYVLVIPIGIVVSYRTMTSLYIGITIATASVLSLFGKRKAVIFVFIVIGIPMWMASYQSTYWFSNVTRALRSPLSESLPQPAANYSGVIVDERKFSSFYRNATIGLPDIPGPYIEKVHTAGRWRAALAEEGFTAYTICDHKLLKADSGPCGRAQAVLDNGHCVEDSNLLCAAGVTEENELVLTFN